MSGFLNTQTVGNGLDVQTTLAAVQQLMTTTGGAGVLAHPNSLPTSPVGLVSGSYWNDAQTLAVTS